MFMVEALEATCCTDSSNWRAAGAEHPATARALIQRKRAAMRMAASARHARRVARGAQGTDRARALGSSHQAAQEEEHTEDDVNDVVVRSELEHSGHDAQQVRVIVPRHVHARIPGSAQNEAGHAEEAVYQAEDQCEP